MKRTITSIVLALLTLLPVGLYAQAPGASCAAAASLTVSGACGSGTISDATVADAPAPSCGAASRDGWYSFIATGTSATVTAISSNRQLLLQVFSGSCGSEVEIGCANANTTAGAQTETVNLAGLTIGNTYLIRVVNQNANNMGLTSICVTAPPANDNPCSATAIAVNASCAFSTYSNAGATNSAGVPAPGCANYLGSDVWFTVTVPASGAITFDSNTGVITDGGMAIYSGSCGSLTLISCDDDNSANGAMPILTVTCQTPGATLWVRFWEYGNDNNGTFQLCAYDPVSGNAPANDAPCGAISLSLGVTTSGSVTSATACNEPATPGCWTGGTLNTVWYSVVCPASGQISVRTGLGTLTNTQIAFYSGTCGPGLTQIGCSDNVTLCSETQNWSEVVATGLTPGATYYIRVDGANSATGNFSITAIDGTSTWPVVFGQDCSTTLPVCASSSTIGNPGFIGSGNYCDYNGGAGCPACITVGERNAVWYSFTASIAGILQFTITPNSVVDYDFSLWDVTGNGAACSQIAAGTLNPIRCSYATAGVTGVTGLQTGAGDNCEGSGGNRFVETVAVVPGQSFVLLVSNFSTSSFVGFNINWGTSPINYASAPNLTWTGASNTDWNTSANWGGCAIPDCTKDIVIFSGPANQPVIPTGTTINCRNITIQAGASLTLQGTAQLNVCGDFTNNGTFTAASTSTVNFQGSGTQNINGVNSGTNSFGNLTLTNNGTVVLNQTTDVTGNLTTTANATVLNVNGRYLRIGGNLNNFNGGTTMTNLAGSTIEFNGTGAQAYNQGTSTLTLNDVLMNKASNNLTLSTNMVVGTSGVMTLTLGQIITGANEVQITNTASGAITAGNTNSFVRGNLRRYLNGAATSYDFPVGHATEGYQRANITFTTATTIPQLLATFNTWGAVPNGPAASECVTATYNGLPAFDNGYWQIDASANPNSGNYNVTLYSTSVGNNSGSGWTVMKSPSSSFTWGLNGTCVVTSTATQTSRTGLNGFSRFAVAQTPTPLPIELLSFTGRNEGAFNRLDWITATEVNNDYFVIERSTDGVTFGRIGEKDGAGNSSSQLSYDFYDRYPAEGNNYYRLKQVDFNGSHSYSGIVNVATHYSASYIENVRPNPTNGEIFFDFVSENSTTIHITITDMFGRVVMDEQRQVEKGRTAQQALINEISGGIYTLKVSDEQRGYTSVTRLVKY